MTHLVITKPTCRVAHKVRGLPDVLLLVSVFGSPGDEYQIVHADSPGQLNAVMDRMAA